MPADDITPPVWWSPSLRASLDGNGCGLIEMYGCGLLYRQNLDGGWTCIDALPGDAVRLVPEPSRPGCEGRTPATEPRKVVRQDATESSRTTCGHTVGVVDADGEEQPCSAPATSWRWYQDVEHDDCLEPACDDHANEGGQRLHDAETERDRVRGELRMERRRFRDTLGDRRVMIEQARAERDRLAAQAAAVREIHTRAVYGEGTGHERVVCDWCRDTSEEAWQWPCPTVAAIEGAA